MSDEECLRFAKCYLEAPVGDNGVFRIADIPVPDGETDRWAFHILERRDASHLQELAAASINSIDATVVDGTKCAPTRTVTVFGKSGSRSPLVSMRRGEDLGEDDLDGTRSLAAEALEEFRGLMGKGKDEHGTTPLICLEPELAIPKERRRFLTDGIPYAIKVDAEHQFSYPTWSPDDPFDAFDHTTAESIIAAYCTGADPAKATYAPIRDLQGRGRMLGMYEEYLFRFPPAAEPEYFVTRPALPPSTPPLQLMQKAFELAEKAWSYARSSPGKALRLHEFQSPHYERYRQVVSIVARARDLKPLLGKEPGNAPPGA